MKKYKLSNFDQFFKIFNIIIDIKDYALGGTLDKISEVNQASYNLVKTLAKLVFSDNLEMYKRRFYENKYLRQDFLAVAQDVWEDRIKEEDFSNLVNLQLQEVLKQYRKEKDKQIGSSLFNRISFDYEFTNWVKNFPQDKLEDILKEFEIKLSSMELLYKCSLINKNVEILKYLVYNFIHHNISELYLSETTGKGVDFILRYEKLIFEKKIQV